MLKSKTRWVVRQFEKTKVKELVEQLKITPLVASLLIKRGIDSIESAKTFLFDEGQSFHDPFLLNDMEKAVLRIKAAIRNREPILVYGDYDADGVSSTSVMLTALQDAGAMVDFYIPNRFTEGYGPNEAAFRYAVQQGFKIIITVDTGISAIHEAKVASELGIDLIITDHHEPGPELPNAYAIIHPKLENSQYPFKDLAGVGVALKVAQALYEYVPDELLELAAIGTVADLVPLHGENRLIVKKGLKQLQITNRVGLQALYKLAKVEASTINEETIGFVLGPRINAAGRLDCADPVVHLLLTKDVSEAELLAEEIDEMNKERQKLVQDITEEAFQIVQDQFSGQDNYVLVVGKEGWNAGVIGIVASKLVDKFYRPVIVLSYDSNKGLAKGSARSIAGFDLFQNLSQCRELLPHFGGHPMAAGMTLKLEDVSKLREQLNLLAMEQLTEEDFTPIVEIDTKVSIEQIDIPAIEQLGMMAPFGMSNPKPKVLIEDLTISSMRKIGSDQTHLKVLLQNGEVSLDGIGFGFGAISDEISPLARISVIGELAINEWNNIRKPQIFIQDIAVNEMQIFDYRGIKKIEKLVECTPVNDRVFIVFNEATLETLSVSFPNKEIVLFTEDCSLDCSQIHEKTIVLVDMPSSKEQLVKLFKDALPNRVYVVFSQSENHFFSTMPTRDHFKWFYGFLAKRGTFDLKRFGDDLAKHRGWSKETIEFMSQVFFELDFVKINGGFISLSSSVTKRDLSESVTYKRKQAKFDLENELLYSNYSYLKNWFEQITCKNQMLEEAIK